MADGRALVLSDLHLGHLRGTAFLHEPAVLEQLRAQLSDVRTLVLAGDVLEGRHGPWRAAVRAGEPFARMVGEVLGPDGRVVLLAGNHDHAALAQPSLELLEEPLDVATRLPLTPAAQALAELMAPAQVELHYPGVWVGDVWVHHGHYGDVMAGVPSPERIAAAVSGRLVGRPGARAASPADFEAALAPVYAWLHAVAQGDGWSSGREQRTGGAWGTLVSSSRAPRVLAAKGGFRGAVGVLNALGLGPFEADVSPEALRRTGLAGMREVVRRLGVAERARHVVFGHTHRAGPLPGDDLSEWRIGDTRLWNGGAWVREPRLAPDASIENPYSGGRAIDLTGEEPRLVRLVEP